MEEADGADGWASDVSERGSREMGWQLPLAVDWASPTMREGEGRMGREKLGQAGQKKEGIGLPFLFQTHFQSSFSI